MYGIEAINANNGWAISVVGISIVFSGLVMLSLIISQLYKVLAFWENPSKIKALFTSKRFKTPAPDLLDEQSIDKGSQTQIFTESQKETAKQFDLLMETMNDPFSLPRLLHLARISDVKDPCINLNQLLSARIIVPDGSGFFTRDKDIFDKVIS